MKFLDGSVKVDGEAWEAMNLQLRMLVQILVREYICKVEEGENRLII